MAPQEPRFSEDEINVLLSLDDEWLKIGSRLFLISDGLMEQTDIQRFLDIYVGEKVSFEDDDEFTVGAQIERHASMLFAMAMEAWMKGLLLSQEQESIWGSVKDEYESRIQAAEDSKSDADLESVIKEFWNTVFQEQRSIIDRHRKHDLLQLARDCGLAQYLTSDDLDFLKHLGSAIERGRYPAAFKPYKMQAHDYELANTITWARLRAAVLKRFEDLYPEGL